MENSAVSFHGTRLLTLSACSTAKGRHRQRRPGDGQSGHDRTAEGRRSGAGHAVGRERRQHQPDHERLLCALGEGPADGKAEALRQAQLAFSAEPPRLQRQPAAAFSSPIRRRLLGPRRMLILITGLRSFSSGTINRPAAALHLLCLGENHASALCIPRRFCCWASLHARARGG